MPLHLLVIPGDTECPAIGARKLRDMAPAVVSYTEVFTVPGEDHSEFSWSSPASLIVEFEKAIASDLTAPGEWAISTTQADACSQNDGASYMATLGGMGVLALASVFLN